MYLEEYLVLVLLVLKLHVSELPCRRQIAKFSGA